MTQIYSPDQLAQIKTLAEAIAAASAAETQADADVTAAAVAMKTRDDAHNAAVAAEAAQYQSDALALLATHDAAVTVATNDDGATQAAVAALVAFASNPPAPAPTT